jgi:hypothetical protein
VLSHQSGGLLYQETRTLVLTDDEVARQRTSGMQRSGDAGPHDVAPSSLPVMEEGSGLEAYFLPYNASLANLVTAGLRVGLR